MKRLIIICEGETEQNFCETVLTPYWASRQLYVQAPLIKHSNGGIVRWDLLKKQIEISLRTDVTAIVTLLIDYYGLYRKHGFPNWNKAEDIVNKTERMNFLERSMKEELAEELRHRFVPYIQLHEFEGLLFCSEEVFREVIPVQELVGLKELHDTIEENPNPELINTHRETSPSHRLARIIRGYNKIVYGNILAETIGLQTIREKCPRFDEWMRRLED